jgi:hypothetical protein
MSNEELGELIGSLTQAVERVRITVQLRRLATKKGGAVPAIKCAAAPGSCSCCSPGHVLAVTWHLACLRL